MYIQYDNNRIDNTIYKIDNNDYDAVDKDANNDRNYLCWHYINDIYHIKPMYNNARLLVHVNIPWMIFDLW